MLKDACTTFERVLKEVTAIVTSHLRPVVHIRDRVKPAQHSYAETPQCNSLILPLDSSAAALGKTIQADSRGFRSQPVAADTIGVPVRQTKCRKSARGVTFRAPAPGTDYPGRSVNIRRDQWTREPPLHGTTRMHSCLLCSETSDSQE